MRRCVCFAKFWILSLVCLLISHFSAVALAFSSITPSNNDNNLHHPNNDDDCDMQFDRFRIHSDHIFYRTPLSAAFVNLRPIVPGHVLVMSRRIVARLEDLSDEEYLDVWKTVRVVQKLLQIQYPSTTAANVAVQDGQAAGQSVPHVHVHILPRKGDDFERNDDVYETLDAWAPTNALQAEKQRTNIEVPDDEDRVDRTEAMMAEEASCFRRIVQEQQQRVTGSKL